MCVLASARVYCGSHVHECGWGVQGETPTAVEQPGLLSRAWSTTQNWLADRAKSLAIGHIGEFTANPIVAIIICVACVCLRAHAHVASQTRCDVEVET
jgi:hypothetical protein